MTGKRPDLKTEMASLKRGHHTRALGRLAADRARRAAGSFVADGQRVSSMAGSTTTGDQDQYVVEVDSAPGGTRGYWATAQ